MKRLKVMAALLVILSLAFLCVACGNKPVDSAGEDGNPSTAQQDTTDDKTSADDKTSTGGKTQKENTTPVEGGVVTDGPLTITGGVEKSTFEEDNNSANTKPADSKPDTEPDTKPDNPNTEPDTPNASQDLKWEEYYVLSPEQRDAYFDSFSDYKEFQKWMTKAQEQFRTEHPDIEIGADGTIDLSKLK